MAADEIKICPILPLEENGIEGLTGLPILEPRPCYGERCAWFFAGECAVAGAGLGMAPVSQLAMTLLEQGIMVTKRDAPDMQQSKGDGSDG